MELPGEKVLIRVIEALETGIGGVLRPWQIRRVGRANAEARVNERLLLEQAELDIEDLKLGRKRLDANARLIPVDAPRPLLLVGPRAGQDVPVEGQPPELLEFALNAQDSARARELQHAVNLKRIALYAEEEAEEIDRQAEVSQSRAEGPQAKVDTDWFAKWRNGAQDVSQEAMQRLWGKLLAGEVARPGSFSLHTIDFLSRMSSADAQLLARVAPFLTSIGLVLVGDEFYRDRGLQFSDFLFLDDLGLINGTVGLGLTNKPVIYEAGGRAKSQVQCGNKVLTFDLGETVKSPPKMVFKIYQSTRVCREILTLASFPPNMDYLQEISNFAVSNGAEVVHVGTVGPDGRTITGNQIIAVKPATPKEVG